MHDGTRKWCYRKEGVVGVMIDSGVMRNCADVEAFFPTTRTGRHKDT